MIDSRRTPSIQAAQKAALAKLREEGEAARHRQFVTVLRAHRLAEPVREFAFHPSRLWRFDYAWPTERIALEIEGGIWTRGRHSRGAGMLKDMEKYNTAASMGWRVLRTVPDSLTSAHIVEMLRRVLKVPA